MSAAGVAVAGIVVVAMVVATAPAGALARIELRHHRPELGRPPLRRRRRTVSHRRSAVGAGLTTLGRTLRRRAGRPPDAPADRRVGVAVAAAVASAVVVSPIVAPAVVAFGLAVPVLTARSRRASAERAVRTALPDAVDLFRLAVGAGLSTHQAVEAVAGRAPEPVAGALAEVRRRAGLGTRLGDALDALDELGDPVVPLAAALRGAARYGTPLGASLERVAVDARMLRRRRAEEEARRLPVQLLFPLVVCVLPAFGLLAVVPLLLASLGSLQL